MDAVDSAILARLERYPFVVVSWVDDTGYPVSVATSFKTDGSERRVLLDEPGGLAIPTDREVVATGSHIRPQPGIGYDERRYLSVWGRAAAASDGTVALGAERAWG
jgi:hypothetical protein